MITRVTELGERAEEHYDRIASVYDVERFGCRCGQILNQTELRIVGSLLQHRDWTLDVGTGSGRFALVAANTSAHVIGLDASARMISVAKAKEAEWQTAASVSFILGSAARLPFADYTFDNVVAVRLLSHFEDLSRPISEMVRVLKHGGTLIVDTPNRGAGTYRRFIKNPRISSHHDYSHTFPEIRSALSEQSLVISRRISYAALPLTLLHWALCGHRKVAPSRLLQFLIGSRRGLLTFIQGVRR